MKTKAPRVGAIRYFDPVLFDKMSGNTAKVAKGTRVRVCQPHGCPKNGTMGMCYVEYANPAEAPNGAEFIGLVCLNSLSIEQPAPEAPKPTETTQELANMTRGEWKDREAAQADPL